MNTSDRMLIVVGIDGSSGSDHALAWTLRLAHRLGAAVQAVTVWSRSFDDAAGSPVFPLSSEEQAQKAQRDGADRVLTGTPAASLSLDVVEGAPGLALVDAARGADLLVVASHGHRRIYSLVMGSTSEYCVRHAHCPVVVIPPPVYDPGGTDDLVRRST